MNGQTKYDFTIGNELLHDDFPVIGTFDTLGIELLEDIDHLLDNDRTTNNSDTMVASTSENENKGKHQSKILNGGEQSCSSEVSHAMDKILQCLLPNNTIEGNQELEDLINLGVIDNSEELENKPPDNQQLGRDGDKDASQNMVSTDKFVPVLSLDTCSFDSLVDSSLSLCQNLFTQEDECQDVQNTSQAANEDKDAQVDTTSKLTEESNLDHNVVVPIKIMKLLLGNDNENTAGGTDGIEEFLTQN